MATAPAFPTAAERESVRGPLVKLRGAIRRYVGLEGAAAVGIFFALWFWLGLMADYGSFKLFAFDWVQELPRAFRAVLLVGLSAALAMLVIFKLVRRLAVDFAPQAFALVLEKKFPKILGDRLITAVELADVDRAARQGYSRAMIDETIRDAALLVDRLPINEVFDWARLRKHAGWAVGLMIAPFVLFGGVYSAVKKTSPFVDYLPRFRDVAVTWGKRNLLLQSVIWPRRALLEVLDFPATGVLKIGRDAPSPRLRFRAYRWVYADASAAEGWRAMAWADLSPELLGEAVPELPTDQLQAQLSPSRAAAVQAAAIIAAPGNVVAPPPPTVPDSTEPWTLDRVEIALEDAAVRKRLQETAPKTIESLDQMFAALVARAAEPSSRQTLRRLEVPDRVEVKYWGAQTSNRMELIRGPGWEYTGTLSDLKESVSFWARGADYYTATRTVSVVPPPALQQLQRIEFRPAYLYHRPPLGSPPEGGPFALRGLKQKVVDLVSLNGPTSRVAVPNGTDLILEGVLDKVLIATVLRPRGKSSEVDSLSTLRLELLPDGLGFRHRFGNVTSTLDFDLEFTDTDEVRSSRHVVIEPVLDLPPSVNVLIDGIRRTRQGAYMVTPVAQIPIDGKIADGLGGQLGGLDRIEYALSIARLESAGVVNVQGGWLIGAVAPLIGSGADGWFANAAATADVSRLLAVASPEPAPMRLPLESFAQLYRDRARQDVPRADLIDKLEREPGPPTLLREFVAQPRFEFLDLRDRMPELKVKDELAVQPRYRMKLTIAATDNNVETGPGVSENKEPPFTVLIVSEPELLVEIAREEETLHLKTEDAIARLREARQKLEKTAEEILAASDDRLATFAQRAQEVLDSTGKARDTAQDVFNEYSRILRELELNRVSTKLVEKVKGEICLPLESLLKNEFVAAEESLEAYRKDLEVAKKPDAGPSKQRLDRLIAKLEQIMAAMGELTTINKLIATLREIEKGQDQGVGARLKELQKLQREKLIRDLDKVKGLDDK